MRKIQKFILVCILLLTMFGCSSDDTSTPSGSVSVYMKERKKSLSSIMVYGSGIPQGLEPAFEKVFNASGKFDYEIISETIDGDEAEVLVKIKSYALGNSLTNAFVDVLSQGETLLEAGASEEMMVNLVNQIWMEKIDDEIRKGKQYSITVPIKVKNENGEWIVINEDEGDMRLLNAVTGDLYQIMLSYEE